MVKRIASAFMAKNPDVQVNHLVIPGAEMDAKILTGVAADDPGRGHDLGRPASTAWPTRGPCTPWRTPCKGTS